MLYVNRININDLWDSQDLHLWNEAKEEYWRRVEQDNQQQLEVEYKFKNINAHDVQSMPIDQFYSFIIDDYLKWKFGNLYLGNRQKTFSSYYVEEKKLHLLQEIHNELFSFDLSNVEQGLAIATKLFGLRVIGASGLLAVLFPSHFGTVDRFIIQSLLHIDKLPEHNRVQSINSSDPTIADGVFLIELMKNKADELNQQFKANQWRPRDIDMILWANRDNKANSSCTKNTGFVDKQKPIMNNMDTSSFDQTRTSFYMTSFNMSELQDEFANYLRQQGRKEDRVKEDRSWAFTHYYHNIGIDFWYSLKNERTLNECYECYLKVALNGGFRQQGVKDPRGYASSYIGSVKRLKGFFDTKYGGIDSFLKINRP
ncbi:MAG: hypothetical protein ACM3PE_07515 [Deltaproteobacteria bacterium]